MCFDTRPGGGEADEAGKMKKYIRRHGASLSIEVDTGEPVGSTGLRAAATGIRETTLRGGLKNSSNIGWNKISQSFLVGDIRKHDMSGKQRIVDGLAVLGGVGWALGVVEGEGCGRWKCRTVDCGARTKHGDVRAAQYGVPHFDKTWANNAIRDEAYYGRLSWCSLKNIRDIRTVKRVNLGRCGDPWYPIRFGVDVPWADYGERHSQHTTPVEESNEI
ncbi:hypothetical protein Tco_0461899 [Tanacetum coccineum]